MKYYLFTLSILLGFNISISAQVLDRLGKRVENKVKQRVDRKVDKVIDRSLDNIETAAKSESKTQNSSSNVENGEGISTDYDFIPGEDIIFYDDFSNTLVGDFPIRWNTNSAGQVVKISSQTINWLRVPDNTISFPEVKGVLPENFTIEFDLYYPPNTTRPPVTFGFAEVLNPAKQSIKGKRIFYFRISPSVGENIGYSTSLYSGKETTTAWEANRRAGKISRVSIAVNGQRIRLYVDTEKLFDLPKAFDLDVYRNNFHFRSADIIPKPKDGFYISNLRIAKATKDLRSLIIDEGKFSTSGIYFDVGSDKIKLVSYNLINKIGKLIQDNPNLKFNIIGHTDADGSDQLNQKLSLERAESVIKYLMQNFSIGKHQLVAIGRGSSFPLADNSKPEGRAQNRRVEFIKQ